LPVFSHFALASRSNIQCTARYESLDEFAETHKLFANMSSGKYQARKTSADIKISKVQDEYLV
jgi:hypothetical protein